MINNLNSLYFWIKLHFWDDLLILNNIFRCRMLLPIRYIDITYLGYSNTNV